MYNKFYFGSHKSISKGIFNGLINNNYSDSNFSQIFISNPRSGKFIKRKKKELDELKNEINNLDHKFVIHSPYVLNFSKKFNESNWWFQTLIQELEFADNFDNCIGSVLHFGKALDLNQMDAYLNFVKSVKFIVDNSTNKSKVIIETSAGQGTEICYKLEDFALIWNMFEDSYKERLGICIDTCHIFAAGHDISTKEGVNLYFELFDKLIGKKYISVIHFNDSKKHVGCRVDRHENLGLGCIGLEPLKQVVTYANENKIPLVLETPSDKHQEELALIKSWSHDFKMFSNREELEKLKLNN